MTDMTSPTIAPAIATMDDRKHDQSDHGSMPDASPLEAIAAEQVHARRSERRREETDRKILRATLDIITSQGISAVTIEEISRRSGVAKTTIYRRYRNTDDLLHNVHALATKDSPELSDLSPTRANLQLLLEFLVRQFSSQIGIKAVGVLLSSSNAFFQHIAQQAIQPERNRFAAFFERGVRSGTFKRGLDPTLLFNTIIGSLVACTAFPPSTSKGQWPALISDLLWSAIAAPQALA